MTLEELQAALDTKERQLHFARLELEGWQKHGSRHHIELSSRLVASFEAEVDKLGVQIQAFNQ